MDIILGSFCGTVGAGIEVASRVCRSRGVQGQGGWGSYNPLVPGLKLTDSSASLGRRFHVDVFIVGAVPSVFGLFFGGSGVTAEEYERRSASVIPVFDEAIPGLASLGAFGLVYVTAPFDVPFTYLPDDPVLADRWNRHVRNEIIPLVEREVPSLANLPRYVMGFSGGAILALSGHHLDKPCVGAGMLGPDGLHAGILPQDTWEPIPLIYNVGDDVIEVNRAAIAALRSTVEVFHRLPGSHGLADYVRNDSFRGLVWRAVRSARGARLE